MKAKILDIKTEAENIKLFKLELKEKLSFLPGQSIALTIHDPQANILNQKRYYSVASSPDQQHVELLIKDTSSHSGHYVYEHLAVGDELEVEGPFGKMVLPQSFTRATFIAGGSGISPFLSMIRQLHKTQPNTPLHLFYSTKKVGEAAFHDEFTELHKKGSLTYVHTVTQEPTWKGNKGRITKEFLEKNLTTKEGIFFICGPSQMIKDTVEILKQLNIPESSIIIERY